MSTGLRLCSPEGLFAFLSFIYLYYYRGFLLFPTPPSRPSRVLQPGLRSPASALEAGGEGGDAEGTRPPSRL